MMLKNRNLMAGSVAASLLATTASLWAQSTTPDMESMPLKVLSKAELVAAFVKSDINKDGKLSKLEAEGVPGLVAKFDMIDLDADKFVSRAEFDKAIT